LKWPQAKVMRVSLKTEKRRVFGDGYADKGRPGGRRASSCITM
jgi:hypothetical protein